MSAVKATWEVRRALSQEHSRRVYLCLDGEETPYFIITAVKSFAKTKGFKHGLFGAGMDESGCAKVLDCGDLIAPLKAKALGLALHQPQRVSEAPAAPTR